MTGDFKITSIPLPQSTPSKFFGFGCENFLRGSLVTVFGGVSINSMAYSVVRLKNNEIKHFYQ